MAGFRVTPNELNKRAGLLEELNNKFNAEVMGLNESEATLAGMWEGDAQKEFHKQFQSDKAKFDEFYKGINQYIQRLRDTAEAYNAAESANLSTAQTRKS